MYWSTAPSPTLYSNFLILIFQEHSSLTSSYLVIMSFCKIDVFTYNFNMCPGCCFRRCKVEQDSPLLSAIGAKWQRPQVRATKQPGINITRFKNYFKIHFLMFWLHWSKRSCAHSLKAEQEKQNSFLTGELNGKVMPSYFSYNSLLLIGLHFGPYFCNPF